MRVTPSASPAISRQNGSGAAMDASRFSTPSIVRSPCPGRDDRPKPLRRVFAAPKYLADDLVFEGSGASWFGCASVVAEIVSIVIHAVVSFMPRILAGFRLPA